LVPLIHEMLLARMAFAIATHTAERARATAMVGAALPAILLAAVLKR